MQFSVAAFGDTGKRHGLLGCPPELRPLFLEIANRTDRPGYAPPGVSWPPYLSGFAYKDWYVLMRTFADDAASRQGMVYTVAFAAPLNSFSRIENLRPVVDALPMTSEKQIGLSGAVIEISNEQLARCEVKDLPPRLAEALVSSSGTVVWGDPDSFDEIITRLWSAVWPAVRKSLSFRLSFDPGDIDRGQSPTLVVTLPQVRSRWADDEFIEPSELAEADPTNAAAVLRCTESRNRILGVIRDLEAEDSISDLRQIKLVDALLVARQQGVQSFSSLRSQLQLAAKLSPARVRGAKFKMPILDDLQRHLPEQTSAAEIRGLRNVPWDSFDTDACHRIFELMADWIDRSAVEKAIAGENVGELLRDGLGESGAWGAAVQGGFRRSLQRNEEDVAAAVWLWTTTDLKPYVDTILKLYVTDTSREAWLAAACPNLSRDREFARVVLDCAQKEGWWELHAAVLLRSSVKKAIAAHLAALPQGNESGIERLRLSMGQEFVIVATQIDDVRLINAACRGISEIPELWREFDASRSFWRTLLVQTVESGNRSVLQGEVGRQTAIKAILFLLKIDARNAETASLWKAIALAKPDWSDVLDDVVIDDWSKIPPEYEISILDSTANGWLTRFLQGAPSNLPVLMALQIRITSESRVRLALGRSAEVSSSIALFERFSDLSQGLFVWWIRSILSQTAPVLQVSAVRVGELIASRMWRDAAGEISRLVDRRADLRPALERCIALVGMLRRIQMLLSGGMGSPHEIDAWSALQELAVDLYSWGPGVNDIWRRAGGHTSDIPHFSSGREAWSVVIAQARAGRHAVTPRSLTDAMLEDYPRNSDLKRIAKVINED